MTKNTFIIWKFAQLNQNINETTNKQKENKFHTDKSSWTNYAQLWIVFNRMKWERTRSELALYE